MVKSGITVITTIQVYRSSEVAGNPEVSYVSVPPWWERFRNPPPRRRVWARNLAAYLQHVTGVLQREGVPIIAGTDCGGWAFVIPGFALHDELGLMAAGGLSPYQALRTATVEPAKFLQKPEEFGTIAVGRRADLVMVESNPLENLKTLRKPVGVMARGRWFPASVLEAMLARLAPARQ
jgi:imidazolonepropionase-like amidohydrolase